MYTTVAFFAVAGLAFYAMRQQRSDSQEVKTNIDVDLKALKYLTAQMLGWESGFGKAGAAAVASTPETLDKMFSNLFDAFAQI